MTPTRPTALAAAIARAAPFLVDAQAADGSWRDWQLPPGPADAWVTAFVGRQLITLKPACAVRAAQWLRAHRLGGGWGYNALAGPDADSTALALDLLTAIGITGGAVRAGGGAASAVPNDAAALLSRYRCEDGGFATFPGEAGLGSWGRSCVEVSATIGALLGVDAALAAYLRSRQRADGLWNSFWWRGPLYATRAALIAFGDQTGRAGRTLRATPAGTPFDLALLADCARLAGDRELAARLVARLRAAQLPDGSWASAPVLRLTDRDCTRPWQDAEPGPLFADPNRLFTTATVLRALIDHHAGCPGVARA